MLGKALLTVCAIGLLTGAPMMDLNHTHMTNPHWPPHAKFHNAQTISLSVLLGLAVLYYTHRSSANIPIAALLGSLYWVAGLSAVLYPGTSGLDPEFGGPGFPQAKVFVGFLCCAVIGGWLEMMTDDKKKRNIVGPISLDPGNEKEEPSPLTTYSLSQTNPATPL